MSSEISSSPATPVQRPAVVVPVLSEAHRALQVELCASANSLPVPHRTEWLEGVGPATGHFIGALDSVGRCVGGLVAESAASRALPGHRLLRVQRYIPPADPSVEASLLDGLRDLAQGDRSVLRVGIELTALDLERRRASEALLAERGFVRASASRSYTHTLLVDLRPDEPALLAGLHATARRKIRAAAKAPVEVRPLTEERWAGRVAELLGLSLDRTGGHVGRLDWGPCIAFSRACPSLSRLVGLFRADGAGDEALIAFAWGLNHGDAAHYEAGGSTRATDLKVSMTYPLMWDLLCWAKSSGCARFDLGGVTAGHFGDGEDALGGISDFKRYFSQQEAEVGAEWVLEPRPGRARLARFIGSTARRLSSLRGRPT